MTLSSAEFNENTEYLMYEADCLLENADHRLVVSFDMLMKAWEELGLSFPRRLELAVERLRAGCLPDQGSTVVH